MSRRARRPDLLAGASVPSIVRHAHHGARLACVAESLLMGLGGFGVTLAASLLSGGVLGDRGPFALALFVGVMVVASWLVATLHSVRATAQAIDRRLDQNGAFFTAFEAQSSGSESPLARLLAARVAARVSPRAALRVVRPLSPVPIAAPFVAAAVLALAIEAVAPLPDQARLADLAKSMIGEISDARQISLETLEQGQSTELGEQAKALPRELTKLLAEVTAMESEWGSSVSDPKAALETLSELRRRFDQSLGALPTTGPLADKLRELSNLIDAAAMRAGDAAGKLARGADGSEDSEASNPSLASSGSGGRIADLIRADQSSFAPTAAAGESTEQGAAVAIGWRPEYDEIVSRWIDSRRSVEEN